MKTFEVEPPERGVEVQYLSTNDTFKTLLTRREGIVLNGGDHRVILAPMKEGGAFVRKNLHKKVRVERVTHVDAKLWQEAVKPEEKVA